MSDTTTSTNAPPATTRWAARRILAIGLPMLGGMTFDILYSLTDAFFAARVPGGASLALAGVGAVGPLFFLLVSLAQGIGAGVSVETALASGAKDRGKIEGIASTGLFLALIGGLAMALSFLAFAEPLLRLAAGGAAAEILGQGATYLRWLSPGLPCLFVGHALFAVRQGEGSTRRYGFAMAAATATNAILDPILMLALRLGIAGNAMGTSISQLVFMLLAIAAIRAPDGSGALAPRPGLADRSTAGKILAIGLPQSLVFVAIGIAQGGANLVLAAEGAKALAAQTLASRFEGIALVPTLAFAAAAGILIAQARGAGDGGRARAALRGGAAVVGAGSLALCGAIAALAYPLCSIMAGEPSLAALAAIGAAVLAAGSALGHSSGILGAQVLLALERPIESLGVQVLRLLALPLPLAVLASRIAFGGSAGSAGAIAAWIGLAAGTIAGGFASLALGARALRRAVGRGDFGSAATDLEAAPSTEPSV